MSAYAERLMDIWTQLAARGAEPDEPSKISTFAMGLTPRAREDFKSSQENGIRLTSAMDWLDGHMTDQGMTFKKVLTKVKTKERTAASRMNILNTLPTRTPTHPHRHRQHRHHR